MGARGSMTRIYSFLMTQYCQTKTYSKLNNISRRLIDIFDSKLSIGIFGIWGIEKLQTDLDTL